jgi:rhodanese-related sulfurtransferase
LSAIDELKSPGCAKKIEPISRNQFMTRFLQVATVCSAVLFASPLRAELIDIDNGKLEALIEQGVPVIDVRRAEEWQQTGVIENSKLQTFFDKKGRYDAPGWFAALEATVDTAEPFILICHSGGRSSMIGKWLGKQLPTVYNVEDGIVKWLAEKRPVVAVKP